MPLDSAVPYDYRLDLNSKTNLSLAEDARHTGFGFKMRKRTMTYHIRRKPLELQYRPLTDSIINRPGIEQCKGCTPITPFYALDTRTPTPFHYIHANIRFHVLVDGDAVTDRLATIRWWRNWDAPLSSVIQPSTYKQISPWRDDNLGGGPNWSDAPGTSPVGQPSSWPPLSYLQEFVVGVRDMPEFGFVYYSVVHDTKPGFYRVRMSNGRRITADEWCAIRRKSTPERDYLGSPGPDSDWQAVR